MFKDVQKRVLMTVLYNELSDDDYVNIMDKSRRKVGSFEYWARVFIEEGHILVKTKADPNGTILENREFECLSFKGLDHLDRLQRPQMRWLKENWFVVFVSVLASYSAALSAGLLLMGVFN